MKKQKEETIKIDLREIKKSQEDVITKEEQKEEKMITKLKNIWKYLTWLEEQRMKAAIKCGSAGPLL